MPSGSDSVIRKKEKRISDFTDKFDLDTADRFRAYRGRYPREGYEKGETNPLASPKVLRKPPPLRGA